MKEKTTIPKRVKGTVLFTVVSVMMVLLVFLTATLALAVTANNRAMNNYSTVQTQQTAKAAVNAIMSAMQNDTQLARGAAMVSSDAPSIPIKDISFSYMEDVEQEDGTTVRAETASSSIGKITNASIDYVGTKWILNEDNVLDEKAVIKITATAEQGTASSTCTAYVLRDVKPTNNEEGENMGFVATGGAAAGNHSSVYGGSYFGFNKDAVGAAAPFTTYTANDAATTFETDFQVNGNFDNDSGSALYLVVKKAGTGMTVWNNMTLTQPLYLKSTNATVDVFSSAEPLKYTEIPYIYVENTLSLEGTADCIGNSDIPLNIYCGNIQATRNGHKLYADIYCYDSTATSKFSGDSPQLYTWTTHVLSHDGSTTNYTAGNIYTKGNIEVDGNSGVAGNNGYYTFGNSVYCDGNFIVNKPTIIKGDLWVGGTLTVNKELTVTGEIHVRNSSSIVNAGNIKVDMTDWVWTDPVDTTPGFTWQPLNLHLEPVYPSEGEWYPDADAFHGTYQDDAGNVVETIGDWLKYGTDGVLYKYYNMYQGYAIIPTSKTIDTWVNDSDPSDVRYTTDGILHHEDGYYTKNGVKVDPSSAPVQTYSDTTKFPPEYEKSVLLGLTKPDGTSTTEVQPDGTTKIDSTYKIITTVQDVLNSKNDPYKTTYAVPAGTTYETDVEHNEIILGVNFSDIPNVLTVYDQNNKKYAETHDGAGKMKYVVEGSCTLKVKSDGGPNNGTGVVIKAPAAGSEIWVVLDGTNLTDADDKAFMDGGYLVIDDTEGTGVVNILIKGNVKLSGSGGVTVGTGTKTVSMASPYQYFCAASVVKKLQNSSGTYQIYTQDDLAFRHEEDVVQADGSTKKEWVLDYERITAANVNIFAGENTANGNAIAKLTMGNSHVMTANITAPYMDLEYSSQGGGEPACKIYYNKFDIKSVPNTKVGCIGCCIVHKFSAQNNWELLYVSNSGAEDPPVVFDDALMTGWGILYYENY